jgi:hypothetical protein
MKNIMIIERGPLDYHVKKMAGFKFKHREPASYGAQGRQ